MQKYYDFSKHDADHYTKCEEGFGAIVVAKSFDKVLLEASGPANDRTWGFPKGHRNDKETSIEAAVRETKEITGVSIDEGDFILDDKSNPMTFKIEFPWQYGEDILLYHISKIIEKQKTEPSERPYWNSTKPMKKCVTLYLTPVEMDRFKPKTDATVEWVKWEDAHLRMANSKSNHIQVLHDVFKFLQTLKKVAKEQLPELSKKHLVDVKKHTESQRKMMSQPIAKWPVDKQPKHYKDFIADMKGVSREKSSETPEKSKEKEPPTFPEEKSPEEKSPEETPIVIEESDDTSEQSDHVSEEIHEKMGGGDSSDDASGDFSSGKVDVAKKSDFVTPALYVLFGMILIGMIVLIVYFIYKSSNESFEEWMRLPVA
jgi:hypothetical protein